MVTLALHVHRVLVRTDTRALGSPSLVLLTRKQGTILLGCVSPLVIALLVATSRTRDYHHHFADIVAGCLVGSTSAVVHFVTNFASV